MYTAQEHQIVAPFRVQEIMCSNPRNRNLTYSLPAFFRQCLHVLSDVMSFFIKGQAYKGFSLQGDEASLCGICFLFLFC